VQEDSEATALATDNIAEVGLSQHACFDHGNHKLLVFILEHQFLESLLSKANSRRSSTQTGAHPLSRNENTPTYG
jgi:hypothetical protein